MDPKERLSRVAASPHDARSIIGMAEILQDLVDRVSVLERRVQKLENPPVGKATRKSRSRRK